MRLPFALMFLLGGACQDHGNEGFFIVNNTAATEGGTCTFTGDLTQPFTAAGTIAFDSPSGYVMAPLFDSNLTATDTMTNQRAIRLQGANIHAEVANGGAHQDYSVLFSGTLFPNGGTTNVSFEALPKSSINAFASMNSAAGQNTEVILTITPFGSLGGGRIDGEPFQYPVTIIAAGKGITTGLDYDSSGNLRLPYDPNNMATYGSHSVSCTQFTQVAQQGNPCNPYQDGNVDCCVHDNGDNTGTARCPAVSD